VTQVRARTAENGVVPTVRPLRWRRLCLSSFLMAGQLAEPFQALG
jgi:hypothetical protein